MNKFCNIISCLGVIVLIVLVSIVMARQNNCKQSENYKAGIDYKSKWKKWIVAHISVLEMPNAPNPQQFTYLEPEYTITVNDNNGVFSTKEGFSFGTDQQGTFVKAEGRRFTAHKIPNLNGYFTDHNGKYRMVIMPFWRWVEQLSLPSSCTAQLDKYCNNDPSCSGLCDP